MPSKKPLNPLPARTPVRHISSGSPFESQIGYSRAVVADGIVYVSGTTGYNYEKMVLPDDVVGQCRNIIDTLNKVLSEAGSSLDDVLRVNYVLPDPDEFPECWPILSKAFAKARPAAMMIVARLMTPEMKIEIEVTARISS